ncbi:Ribonuclease H-like protein [Akanthomyces lecanii RCEF 1005]|uniref:Ribonuclease H-like protein n=1 Tax=Akanthomyces lecanii RCEF 1005 TaxID=1081108 RepID=A0A167THH9_CORDF|nr:Ribonuclease H-like protein [Akanthomyces lecanii RCEF 1005]
MAPKRNKIHQALDMLSTGGSSPPHKDAARLVRAKCLTQRLKARWKASALLSCIGAQWKVSLCIDNTPVIDCIGTPAPPSSQLAFHQFQKTCDAHTGMVRVRWCPVGIEGNELADQLAKEGAKMPVGDNVPTVSYRKRHMRSLLPIAF